jgi:hypothetical protein
MKTKTLLGLLTALVLGANSAQAFTCITSFNDPLYRAIQATVQLIQAKNSVPGRGIGVGLCMDLPHSNIFAAVRGPNFNLPTECIGISFTNYGPVDARELAYFIARTETPYINGRNGVIRVPVGNQFITVPICTDDVSSGGPQ